MVKVQNQNLSRIITSNKISTIPLCYTNVMRDLEKLLIRELKKLLPSDCILKPSYTMLLGIIDKVQMRSL